MTRTCTSKVNTNPDALPTSILIFIDECYSLFHIAQNHIQMLIVCLYVFHFSLLIHNILHTVLTCKIPSSSLPDLIST